MNLYTIPYHLFRLNAVFLAAVFVTFSLFYFMQYLIQSDGRMSDPLTPIRVVDASVPVFKNEIRMEIPPPEPIERDPIPELEPTVRDFELSGSGIYVAPPVATAPPPTVGALSIPMADGLRVPLIKVPPTYPSRAIQRGIEGFVEVSFSINPKGLVEDEQVLYAEPEGYFENAALRSVKRWKYSPEVRNGEPVYVYDERQRIVFKMEDSDNR